MTYNPYSQLDRPWGWRASRFDGWSPTSSFYRLSNFRMSFRQPQVPSYNNTCSLVGIVFSVQYFFDMALTIMVWRIPSVAAQGKCSTCNHFKLLLMTNIPRRLLRNDAHHIRSSHAGSWLERKGERRELITSTQVSAHHDSFHQPWIVLFVHVSRTRVQCHTQRMIFISVLWVRFDFDHVEH